MFTAETRLVVRYAETDKMGIVHHSNYPIWFEMGRTDYIRKMGISYSEIEEMGLFLPLIELKCQYKGAARYEDRIIVRTWIKEATGVRLVFSYEVVKEGESHPITIGETVHVWTNDRLKPVNIKKHASGIYEIISRALLTESL